MKADGSCNSTVSTATWLQAQPMKNWSSIPCMRGQCSLSYSGKTVSVVHPKSPVGSLPRGKVDKA